MRVFFSRLCCGAAIFMVLGTVHALPSSAANPQPAMGVQFHAMWSNYTDAQRTDVLDKMAAAGVKWVRVDVGWASFQEHGRDSISKWYVDLFDRVVDGARARGMQVLATLWRTPSWANGGDPVAPPDDPEDYARIAKYVAEHYKGRVAAWEVWNEPNHPDYWHGTVAQYVQLLKAAYPQFKAGDPDAKVLVGGPSSNDTIWLKKVYEAGAAGYFDVMATHPYQGMADAPPEYPSDGHIWWITHTPAVRDLMTQYGDGDKEIWFTEFGWSSHDNWPGVENWNRGVTLEQQGDFLVRTLRFVGENYPYVTNVFWYNERNQATGNVQLDNYGLLNHDLSPKPAYFEMKEYLTGAGSGTTTPSPEPSPTATASPTPTPQPSSADDTSGSTPDPSEPDPGDDGSGLQDGDSVQPDGGTNLLTNGGFEKGKQGWKPRGRTARLSVVYRSHSGVRAGKLTSRRPVMRMRGHAVGTQASSKYQAGGFVKASKRGQMIMLKIVERRMGKRVGYGWVKFRAQSTRWTRVPTLTYRTSGRAGTVLKLKLRSERSARYLVADDLWLTRA